jgi:hypothetical protein
METVSLITVIFSVSTLLVVLSTYTKNWIFSFTIKASEVSYEKPKVELETPKPKHGIDFCRRLNPEEIEVLKTTLENVNELIPRQANQVAWLNLYFNQKFTVPHDYQEKLHQLVNKFIAEQYKDFETIHILSYGFLVNPAGSTKFQQFHFDYTESSSNLFVPMTKVTFKNATQFLRMKMNSKMDYFNNFGEIDEIMEKEDVDYVEVSQLACKPYLLTKMHPSTCHRGIANSDDFDRLVFWVTVDNHLHLLEEDVTFKETIGDEFRLYKENLEK